MNRLVNVKEAAAYCSLSVSGFRAWTKRVGLRLKVRGANLYDLTALDHYLDRINGIASKPVLEDDNAFFQRELRKANKNVVPTARRKPN